MAQELANGIPEAPQVEQMCPQRRTKRATWHTKAPSWSCSYPPLSKTTPNEVAGVAPKGRRLLLSNPNLLQGISRSCCHPKGTGFGSVGFGFGSASATFYKKKKPEASLNRNLQTQNSSIDLRYICWLQAGIGGPESHICRRRVVLATMCLEQHWKNVFTTS